MSTYSTSMHRLVSSQIFLIFWLYQFFQVTQTLRWFYVKHYYLGYIFASPWHWVTQIRVLRQQQTQTYWPVCVLRCAFKWELLVYTLLQPSKSHLWILLFLESGDSDRRGRRMLSILNGDMELQREKKKQYKLNIKRT